MSVVEPRRESGAAQGTAAALRRVFDESFAAPAMRVEQSQEGLLAIRVGGDPYVLRLGEIAGLHADLRIVPVPSAVSEFIGMVALRGMMAPVYDLAALLRYPRPTRVRWLALVGRARPVVFVFEALEAHVSVPTESLTDAEHRGNDARGDCLRGTLRAAGSLRRIIHLPSVMELIRNNES